MSAAESAATQPAVTQPAATQPTSDVVRGDGYAIRLPKGWRDDPTVLLNGGQNVLNVRDGRSFVDEVGQPLLIGITVRKSPIGVAWLTRFPEMHARKAETSRPQLTLIGEATTRPITLADGTAAVILITQFNKQPQRHLLRYELFAFKQQDGSGWLVTGEIEGAGRSKLPSPRGEAANWLLAHVVSFVFDADKQDLSPLPPTPMFAERREAPVTQRPPGKKGLK